MELIYEITVYSKCCNSNKKYGFKLLELMREHGLKVKFTSSLRSNSVKLKNCPFPIVKTDKGLKYPDVIKVNYGDNEVWIPCKEIVNWKHYLKELN